MMHGNDWRGQDVAGWWVSEKFNGHRVLWTGRKLITRGGHELNCPEWFTSHLPTMDLDCELHAGRYNDHNTVKRLIAAGDWSSLTLTAFDVPSMNADESAAFLSESKYGAQFGKVSTTDEAKSMMRGVVIYGGEGIMLRRPGSDYVGYRTNDLLKMKP